MSLLKHLCSPNSVALIGVSRKTGAGALNPLQILIEFGYKGKIFPVNPLAENILGYKCYKKIDEIPEAPELAVIMVNRELVPQTLTQSAQKGIKTAIIISDGFAEADKRGKELQRVVKEICDTINIRVLGPNSMGVVNYYAPFTTSFVKISSSHISPVAFIGQSGLFVQGFSNLYIGKAIDIGNGCDIDFDEIISELIDDPEIKIIAVHIEELKNTKVFSRVIKEKGHQKPIIIFKSGKTEKAKKALMSHSGSIAGDYSIYKAFFLSIGLLIVESTQELEDTIYLLSKLLYIPENRKVGIITPSGGAGIISLDSLESNGFELAKLSKTTLHKISKIFPSYYNPSNPLDIMSASFRYGYKHVYTEALVSMVKDKEVDIILCINGLPTLKTISSVVKSIKDCQNLNKPIISWIIGEYKKDIAENLVKDMPIAVFVHPERAFKALNLCMEHKIIKNLSQKDPEFMSIDENKIQKILDKNRKQGADYLFSDAFDILEILGLPIPKTFVAQTIDDSLKILKQMKTPICIKAEVQGILHKKKKGLIKLGITNDKDLISAYKNITDNIDKEYLRTFVMQEMVSEGIEIFMGVKWKADFGHIFMAGKGGADVEIYKDINSIIIPFNKEQALYFFKKTKISTIIDESYIEQLLNIMLAISTLCQKFPFIKDIDLNPIILNQEGIWIVDVKIII